MALFGSMTLAAGGLCAWQLQRRQWKLSLVDERAARLAEPPAPLVGADYAARAPFADWEHRRVALRAPVAADASRVLLLGPRSRPAQAGEAAAGGMATTAASGYLVLVPVTCAGGARVLLNAGWLPRGEGGRPPPRAAVAAAVAACLPAAGAGDVVGVVRGGEKKGTFTPDNAPTALYWLDAPHARRAAGLPDDAWIVDALDGDGSGAGGGGGGGFDAGGALARKPLSAYTEFYVSPEKHLGYAATWLGVAAAAAAIGVLRLRRGAGIKAAGKAARRRRKKK